MLDNSLQLLHPTNRRSFTENKCNINNSIDPSLQQSEYAVFEHPQSQQGLGFLDPEEQFLSGNQEFLPLAHSNHINYNPIGEQCLIQPSYFKSEDPEIHVEVGVKQSQQFYDQTAAEISAKSSFSDSTLASCSSMNYCEYSKPSQQWMIQTPQQQQQQQQQPYNSQNYYLYPQQQQSQLENQSQQISDSNIRQPQIIAPKCGSYLCSLKHQPSYHQHPQQQAMQQSQYIDYYNIYEQQQQVKRPVFSFPDEKPFRMQFHQHRYSSEQYYKQQFPQPQQVFIPEPSDIPIHDDHFTLPLNQPQNERLAEFFPSNEAQYPSSCAASQFFPKAPVKCNFQGQLAPNEVDEKQNQQQIQSQFLPLKFPVLSMKKPNSIKIELCNISEQMTEENDSKIISKTESEPQREAALSSSHTLLRRATTEASTVDQQDQEIQDNPEINSANNHISHEPVSPAEIAEHTDFYTAERKTEITIQMQKSNKKNVVRNIMRTFKQYFLAKQTGEQIMDTFFSGQNAKDVQQKFKRYFSQRKFNHQAIKQLVQHEKYGVVFHQFLKAHSIAFLKTTKPKVQELHQTFIDFLLLCYWDIELLDNLETYSKIKNPFQ